MALSVAEESEVAVAPVVGVEVVGKTIVLRQQIQSKGLLMCER